MPACAGTRLSIAMWAPQAVPRRLLQRARGAQDQIVRRQRPCPGPRG